MIKRLRANSLEVETHVERTMSARDKAKLAEMDKIYEEYGKPLEAAHWGKFVAIAPDGRTVLGDTRLEAAERGLEAFGRGISLFKVGERVVGRMR
jgi:hypothetical protein